MKGLLIAIFTLTPLFTIAQDVYLTGGYVTDRPTLKDNTNSGYIGPANGLTVINSFKQKGFFVGGGICLKDKKTKPFGLRIEASYERHSYTMETTVTTQVTPFQLQTTFPETVTGSNSYLRLSPTITYYKLRREAISYQADLGFSQLIHLGGFKDNKSFTAIHISGGLGYGGLMLKAGAELGLGNNNTLGGERADDYRAISKRFFVGVNVYPFLVMKPKKAAPESVEVTN